jgi:putative AlgH/UPF0301 family transcriptional regulator
MVIGLSVARAAGLSEPVMLVATSVMNGSAFEQTVVLAVPLPNGGHIGFIVNKPTSVRLAKLFPDDAAARKVTEPVYFGGTELLPGVFAITRRAPKVRPRSCRSCRVSWRRSTAPPSIAS